MTYQSVSANVLGNACDHQILAGVVRFAEGSLAATDAITVHDITICPPKVVRRILRPAACDRRG